MKKQMSVKDQLAQVAKRSPGKKTGAARAKKAAPLSAKEQMKQVAERNRAKRAKPAPPPKTSVTNVKRPPRGPDMPIVGGSRGKVIPGSSMVPPNVTPAPRNSKSSGLGISPDQIRNIVESNRTNPSPYSPGPSVDDFKQPTTKPSGGLASMVDSVRKTGTFGGKTPAPAPARSPAKTSSYSGGMSPAAQSSVKNLLATSARPPGMAKGGKVRGCGMAKKGVRKAKMY